MMIDIPVSVVEDLRKLLTQLDDQYEVIKDNTMGWFLHDTLDSYKNNSDPEELHKMDIQTLALAKTVKTRLKL